MINYFNILFAFFFVILIQVLGYANTNPGWFTMASVFLLYLGVYGQVYRRTHCILAREDSVLLYGFKGEKEIKYSEMKEYTYSYSFGGYKVLDKNNSALFRWALHWSRISLFETILRENGIAFTARRKR
ncbi:MAG: hypothetical protein J5959_00980 [Butyrivibrio sp.]|nr:hypothetical protein [Butyrivibrio sp.]MBP3239865.1 hypothetical protein [Oribacterium sp.]